MYATVSFWVWTNRMYVCIDVRLNVKLLFVFKVICGRNLTPMCCANTPQWRWRLCLYVRWIYTTVSRWTWTKRMYVRSYWMVCVLSFEYEAAMSPWRAVEIYCNGDGGYTFMFVKCMQRCCVCSGLAGPTDGAFVMVCVWIRSGHSCPMQYEIVISPWCPNAQQWRWRLCVHVCSMYGTVSCLRWNNRV